MHDHCSHENINKLFDAGFNKIYQRIIEIIILIIRYHERRILLYYSQILDLMSANTENHFMQHVIYKLIQYLFYDKIEGVYILNFKIVFPPFLPFWEMKPWNILCILMQSIFPLNIQLISDQLYYNGRAGLHNNNKHDLACYILCLLCVC